VAGEKTRRGTGENKNGGMSGRGAAWRWEVLLVGLGAHAGVSTGAEKPGSKDGTFMVGKGMGFIHPAWVWTNGGGTGSQKVC